MFLCRPKRLPIAQMIQAAAEAAFINPANAVRLDTEVALAPSHIALMTQKYWGNKGVTLGVQFLSSVTSARKAKILLNMNAWGQNGKSNVTFKESSQGDVRIAFEQDGYWSYIGTDIRLIPAGQSTMNLQGFDGDMPDSEYLRVVRHETGHTLGFPHEHQRREVVDRIDPQKAYNYFRIWDGWDKPTVDAQVLTSLDDQQLMKTPPDVTSIMCYDMPGEIMKDGVAVPGGGDIDKSDADFCVEMYPGSTIVTPPTPPPSGAAAVMTLREDAPAGNFTAIFGNWPNIRVVHGNFDQPLKAGKHNVS